MTADPHRIPIWPARLIAVALGLVVLGGTALTLAGWIADSAAARGNFSRAVRYRPDLAIYRREYGETLLAGHPAQARAQFQSALQRDPYDSVAAGDLTVAELATGADREAWRNETQAAASIHHFFDAWILTNLALTRHDNVAFWQSLRSACALASPQDFDTIVDRVLTATHFDYKDLRASLPATSIPAAAAYMNQAVAHQDPLEAETGLEWLASLHASDPSLFDLQRSAVENLLNQAWQRWPDRVVPVWQVGRAAGLLVGPDKDAGTHRVIDGDFSPQFAPERNGSAKSPVTPLMTWQVSGPVGVLRVVTGESDPPTAAALDFQFTGDVSQDPTVNTVLVDQWVLATGGEHLAASAVARLDGAGTGQGVRLELLDTAGHPIDDLLLPAGQTWTPAHAEWIVPGSGLQAFRLALAYRRPLGAPPLAQTVFVSSVGLQPAR